MKLSTDIVLVSWDGYLSTLLNKTFGTSKRKEKKKEKEKKFRDCYHCSVISKDKTFLNLINYLFI